MQGPLVGPLVSATSMGGGPFGGGAASFVADTGMIALGGQSNMVAAGADYGGTGGGGQVRGADQGYGISISTPFAAVNMWERYATAPTTPMNYFDTGYTGLLPYSGSGRANMGPEQTLGRWLVNHGVWANPTLAKFAVSSTRLDVQWLSTFPSGTATTMYQDGIAHWQAVRAQQNRQYDAFVWLQGESDAGSSSPANAYQANLGVFFTRVRTDLGVPNLPVFIVQLNLATGAGAFRDTVRAAQAAYVASDPNAYLVNVDDVFIGSDPHYDMIGEADIGERIARAVQLALKPGLGVDLGPSGSVFYQGAAAGCTAISGSFSFPRSHADVRSGDREYLVGMTYPNTGSVFALNLTTGSNAGGAIGTAGFVPVTGGILSTFTTTIQKSLSVWERIIGPGTPTQSNGRPMAPSLQVLSGTSPLNVGRVFAFRGGVTGSTSNFVVAANNANGVTLTFPAVTSSVSNSLAVGFVAYNAANNSIKSVTNAAMSNVTVRWDSMYNPNAGTIELGMFTALMPNPGAYGPTTVTLTGSAINVGLMAVIAPASLAPQGFAISPANPSTLHTAGVSTVQLTAGGLVGGTSQDLTSTSAWTSANPLVAAVVGGLVTGLVPGTTTVTATAFDGTVAGVTVTVAV